MKGADELAMLSIAQQKQQLEQKLQAMATNPAEAEEFLLAMGQALFPGGLPSLEQATWTEAAKSSNGRSGSGAQEESAEARLLRAEQRFKALVEQIPALVFFAVLGEG